MKTLKIVSVCVLLSLVSFSGAFAQTKKQLKAEVERLREELFALNQDNLVLKHQRDELTTQNETYAGNQNALQSEINRLERRIGVMEQEYEDLADAYQDIREDKLASGEGTGGGVITGPDRSESRTCALLETQLTENTSYALDYTRLSSDGWGVQVYSFSTLCQAEEKAAVFSQKYTMYKTYIRVKQVKGRRIYSVVYGSLKDQQQARTYCNNFRKIAKDKAGKSAFIVQH